MSVALVKSSPNRSDGKIPPHDPKSEAALLTTMILKPEVIPEALAIVDPEDFFWAAHRAIAESIRDLRAADKPIDEMTVHIDLQAKDKLRVLGDNFLFEMMNQCPVVSNPRSYASAVRNHAVMRRLSEAALRIHVECYEPQEDPAALVERAATVARELAIALSRGTGSSLGDTARAMAHAAANPVAVTAPTGLKWLDQQIGGGLRPGQLFYLGARSGSGKSVLACQIAIASVNAGKRVLYASMEMPSEEVLERLACTYGDVSYVGYTMNTLGEGSISRFNLAVVELVRSKRLHIVARPSMTVMELEAEAVACGAEVVIADYVQLLKGPRGQRFNSPREQVESVSKDLKGMAMRIKAAVAAPCQLNRASATDNRRPVMTDLREAGGLENDADGIIFVWRPQYTNAQASPEERNAGEIIIGKLRRLPFGQSQPVRLGKSGFEEDHG